MIGGTDLQTGEESSQIWSASLNDNTWSQLRTSFAPVHVLAATYHYKTGALYVLDAPEGREQARLTAVNATTGAPTELARFRTTGEWDDFWLEPDLQGNLLLVQSSASASVHRVTRIALSGGVAGVDSSGATALVMAPNSAVLLDAFVGPYPLARAPMVDRGGISRLVLDASGTPSLLRSKVLPMAATAISWDDVGAVPTTTAGSVVTGSCASSTIEFPTPSFTTTAASSITGAITAANGAPLPRPIALSTYGQGATARFFSSAVPMGQIVVTWTVVDYLGFPAETLQTFTVEAAADCSSSSTGP